MAYPLKGLEESAKHVGRMIGSSLPPGVGFLLVVFDFGDPGGNMTYLSNGDRADCIRLLEELTAKMKAQDP